MRECLGVGVGIYLAWEVRAGYIDEGTLSRELKKSESKSSGYLGK